MRTARSPWPGPTPVPDPTFPERAVGYHRGGPRPDRGTLTTGAIPPTSDGRGPRPPRTAGGRAPDGVLAAPNHAASATRTDSARGPDVGTAAASGHPSTAPAIAAATSTVASDGVAPLDRMRLRAVSVSARHRPGSIPAISLRIRSLDNSTAPTRSASAPPTVDLPVPGRPPTSPSRTAPSSR
jgi:hypothetical protein